MSSGLCFNKGLITRGSCTDATWKDNNCAKSCLDCTSAFHQLQTRLADILFEGNLNATCPITPHSWTTIGDVDSMGWCCGFPLSNGSCAQGFEVKLMAGAVLEDNTATSGKPDCAHVCQASHDVAVGLGVGIPTLIACISVLLLYLRERRARRKEKRQAEPLKNDETSWLKNRADGRSVTTITSDEPPWIKNRVEANARPSVPHIELEEMPWRREARELR